MTTKPKILVVDDEVDIAETLAGHFKFKGYDVATAGNGKEALERLAADRAEVVITDIKMPVMDGVELSREIKTLYPMVRLIAITGQVTSDNLSAVFRQGADRCCFKPLTDLAELDSAVERALDDLKDWRQKLKDLDASGDTPD